MKVNTGWPCFRCSRATSFEQVPGRHSSLFITGHFQSSFKTDLFLQCSLLSFHLTMVTLKWLCVVYSTLQIDYFYITLPVRRRIEFKTATLCFKTVRLGNPPYLKNMLKPYEPLRSLRSSTMDLLTDPRTLSLSLRFKSHFPGEPGLTGVYWSKGWWIWWWQLDYTGAISHAKLQSNHQHQQTKIQFFTGRVPNQQCQSTEGKIITFHGLAHPKLTWGLPTLSLTTNSSWQPWGGLPCLSSVLRCQYPRTDTSFGLRRFSVARPRIWNGLPHEPRQCNTLPCFKSHLKTYYFRHHMDN